MEDDNYELISLDTIFMNELIKIMEEYKLNDQYCTKEEVRKTISLGVSVNQKCWEDLMIFVLYGNNKKAKTKGILRAMIKSNRFNLFR